MSTIVALSTPPGRSAIALIRLSGPDSIDIVGRLTSTELLASKPRTLTLKTIRDPSSGEVLDKVFVTCMPRPNSFTGEEMVELSCHGSPIVVRRIIDLLLDQGARVADPGEFTLRALGNGKLDLSQAEAIRDLINSQSAAAAQQAIRQLGGELSSRLQPLKDSVISAVVRLESAVEFVEDDLPPLENEALARTLNGVIHDLRKLASTFRSGHWLRDGIKVTIAGSPNVGKSSLFNNLLRSDRAIVTDIPGTTRDTLSETISISGVPVVLTDTAGLRDTEDKVESIGVDRAQQAMADADLVILVIDGSSPVSEDEVLLFSRAGDSRYLVAANKCDLPSFRKPAPSWGPSECVSISALRGDGLEELRQAIVNRVGFTNSENAGFLITDARHFDLLNKGCEQVEAATALLEQGASEELVLVGLHNSLTLLGAITGETTTEDILSQIFSTFCIGK